MKPIVANKYSMTWNHVNIHLYQDGWKMPGKEAKSKFLFFGTNCEVVAENIEIREDSAVGWHGMGIGGSMWQTM